MIDKLILYCMWFSAYIMFLFIIVKISEKIVNIYKLKNYESYITVLEYHMQKAYDIIYKEQIMIYSIEATRPDENLLNKAMNDYLRLVLKFLGPKLIHIFSDFYGNESAFYFNIVEFFNMKYESDEIKKASVSKLMGTSTENNL